MTADLELKHKNVTKARSIIEKARLRNPQNPDLWRKAVLIEWEYGSKDQVCYSINSF
jgi:pre-mRNA-processing factor 6